MLIRDQEKEVDKIYIEKVHILSHNINQNKIKDKKKKYTHIHSAKQ